VDLHKLEKGRGIAELLMLPAGRAKKAADSFQDRWVVV
jgi:hypothetical protein